jgi:hypothetical protein
MRRVKNPKRKPSPSQLTRRMVAVPAATYDLLQAYRMQLAIQRTGTVTLHEALNYAIITSGATNLERSEA